MALRSNSGTRATNSPSSLDWATQFTELLQFSNQEKKLKPEAAIVYKDPPTLATKLTNYKKLSQILLDKDNPVSYPCENFKNYINMVETVGFNTSHSNSKKFNIK